MKNVPWEIFIPMCVTVIGGLLFWALRAMIRSLGKSITEETQKEINDLKNRVSTNENNIKNNWQAAEEAKKRAEFLMQYLLEKKS
jgi:Sec-independent protein translocase protein TatA